MPPKIPFYDFGGQGPLLHFAAPNAYTPQTFRQFIEPFLPYYRVIAIMHRPLWPQTSPDMLQHDWHLIATDLLAFLEQQHAAHVIGLGHSLGAVATAYAALERPELFRCLLLVDPVFLPPQLLQQLAAHPETLGYAPMVEQALRRRQRWPNRQAAFDRFRGKKAFQRWSDAAVWDYVNYSLVEDINTGDVVLAWPREWEARFYALPPKAVWDTVSRLEQPTLAIRGAESDTLFPQAWSYWQQRQPEATFIELPDVGHMMMMERPQLVAETILAYLQNEL